MKAFLAVYTGAPSNFEAWQALDDATRTAREAAGMKAWGEWGEKHAAVTVLDGGPLGRTKRVGPEGVTDIRNNLGGFIVINAEDHAAAARLFENHPHFTIFPGDGVEIMEILPVPGA